MNIGNTVYSLRTEANLSQEQFANLFGVSQQAVQKWESNVVVPEISKLVSIAKHFGLSLDALVQNTDNRVLEKLHQTKELKPQTGKKYYHWWEHYPSYLMTEYKQSVEEGLDIEAFKEIFESVSRLPDSEHKEKLADTLFSVVLSAKTKSDYRYKEPSELEAIRALCEAYSYKKSGSYRRESQINGAWFGRMCGCLLGHAVECIGVEELTRFLKETKNYPMHRYILKSDLTEELLKNYGFPFAGRNHADAIDGMVADDDTNYTVMAQILVEKYGRNFTPFDVSQIWLDYQPRNAYCTAELCAHRNFRLGYYPPESALYKNPFREWIGAQIRADYFGYINPGNPELAAEMAWRDASISHVKNGIYGAMFVAAMLAAAAETDNMKEIVLAGLGQIPKTSRLYEAICEVLFNYENGVSQAEAFKKVHAAYNERGDIDGVHTIPNAMIVVISLLYGNGDYGKSVCMSVEVGFDTDCNAATVGSVIGMAKGIENIPEYWTKPIQNTLYTTVCRNEKLQISDLVQRTLEHIEKA